MSSKNGKIYTLEADGVTMSEEVESVEAVAVEIVTETTTTTAITTGGESSLVDASGNATKMHPYDITESRYEEAKGYGENPFEVHVTVDVPRRKKTFTFTGKGKSFEEASKQIDVDVRREIQFWKYCIGVNRNEERFPSKPIDYEKRREPQLYHGGESDVTRACAPITGQTHPHRHSG